MTHTDLLTACREARREVSKMTLEQRVSLEQSARAIIASVESIDGPQDFPSRHLTHSHLFSPSDPTIN